MQLPLRVYDGPECKADTCAVGAAGGPFGYRMQPVLLGGAFHHQHITASQGELDLHVACMHDHDTIMYGMVKQCLKAQKLT